MEVKEGLWLYRNKISYVVMGSNLFGLMSCKKVGLIKSYLEVLHAYGRFVLPKEFVQW